MYCCICSAWKFKPCGNVWCVLKNLVHKNCQTTWAEYVLATVNETYGMLDFFLSNRYLFYVFFACLNNNYYYILISIGLTLNMYPTLLALEGMCGQLEDLNSLMMAIHYQQWCSVRILVKCGADLAKQDMWGRTPLYHSLLDSKIF